jgi:hypothetical protein
VETSVTLMVLPLNTSRALRTPDELRALVSCIRDAPSSEQETNWLEWKAQLSFEDRSARASLSKGILGFANRDPEVARRFCAGAAYFMVGVEPQSLPGAPVLDSAKLESQIAPYVGEGPRWHSTYVQVDGTDVLVITIEAPEPGDSLFPARKAYSAQNGSLTFDDGTLFIRRAASTERVNSAEIQMLGRRAQPSGEKALAVEVTPTGPPLERFERTEKAIGRYVKQERVRLLAPLRRNDGGIRNFSLVMAASRESRTPDAYREQVTTYAADLAQHLWQTLEHRALLQGLSPLLVSVFNPTDHPLQSVEVVVELETSASTYAWQYELGAKVKRRPEPPRLFGTEHLANVGFSLGPSSDVLSLSRSIRPLLLPRVERSEGIVRVTYPETNIRPLAAVNLLPVWVLLDEAAPDTLNVSWQAGAMNATSRASGEFSVPVGQDPRPLTSLMAHAAAPA